MLQTIEMPPFLMVCLERWRESEGGVKGLKFELKENWKERKFWIFFPSSQVFSSFSFHFLQTNKRKTLLFVFSFLNQTYYKIF